MIGSDNITINGLNISLQSSFALPIRKIITDKKLAISLIDFLTDWRDKGQYIYQKTSGTTGLPKEIRLKKEAMVASAQSTCTFFNLTKSCNLLLNLDTEYIAGKMMVIRALVSGGNLLVIPAQKLAVNYPQQTIDFVAMVPLQLQQLLDFGTDLTKTKTILLGGAPVTEMQAALFKNIKSTIWLSYASTETCSHVALRAINGEQSSETYRALPNISFSISERETLIITAPHLLEKPLETNDLVALINAESFVWVGRADNVINSGGVKVFPELIEKEIAPHVKYPFFISSKIDNTLGEKVILVIEKASPLTIEEEAHLLEVIRKLIPPYKAPKEISYQTNFTRTPTGKIIRH